MDFTESQSISNWFEVVLKFLEVNGFPKQQVLSELGLNKQLPGSSTFYPLSQLSQLWLYAYEKFGTTVGILVAEQFKPYHWSDVGLLLQSCKNLDEFFIRICQFVPLISTAMQLDYKPHNDNEKKFTIQFKEPVAIQTERIEACILCGWKMANLLLENGGQFLRFEHVRPKPSDTKPWEAIFGSNILWGKSEATIYISNQELFQPANPVNEKLSQTIEQELSSKLFQLYSSNYTFKVKNEILNALVQGQPSLENIANHLNLSPRSLQRHLEDEGSSFRQLLTMTQMNLAKAYLIQTQYSLFEIALRIGFSNTSNFSSAFKKWAYMSPGQYRDTHKNTYSQV